MGKYRTSKQTQQCFPSPDKKQCYKNPPSGGGDCRSNSTNPINHNPSGLGQVWNFWPVLAVLFAGFFFLNAEAVPVYTEVPLDNRDAGTVEPNSSPFDYYSATSLLFPESFKTNLNVYSYESGAQNGTRAEMFEFQNCTPPGMDNYPPDLFTKEQRRSGAIAIHFIVSAYLFYALLFICDDYFVPSIECICTELKIPSDIAGATFMAISTSAPELFTNIFGTFVTKGDTGVGTIVGSAVFNILAVGACCGIGTLISGSAKITSRNGKIGIPLDWWSLTRDCAFYSLSVLLLLGVLANRRVYWYEALSLLVLYGIYMIVMCNNASFKKGTERLINCFTSCFSCCWASSDDEDNLKNSLRRLSLTLPKPKSVHGGLERIHEKTPLLIIEDEKNNYNYRTSIEDSSESSSSSNASTSSTSSSSTSSSNEHLPCVSSEILDELLVSKAIVRSQSYSVIEEEEYGLCHFPRDSGLKSCLAWTLGWPIRLVFTLTIPDCRDPKVRKFYPITLILCICWIGGLTYVVSWMMSIIGETLHIPDSVTGLTFLAAGTSIPEVLSSVIVARQGLGSMGLSNSIGSNTFDLLFCLGLPWLIENLILIWGSANPPEVTYIEIHSGGLEYSIILLITSLLVFYLIIAANGFYLDIKVGISSLVMYGIFITLAIMLELNVFFDVNLPQCD